MGHTSDRGSAGKLVIDLVALHDNHGIWLNPKTVTAAQNLRLPRSEGRKGSTQVSSSTYIQRPRLRLALPDSCVAHLVSEVRGMGS